MSREEASNAAARAAAEADALQARMETMEASLRSEVDEASALAEAKFEALILEKTRATEEAVSALAAQEAEAREEQADQARLQAELALKEAAVEREAALAAAHAEAAEQAAAQQARADAEAASRAALFTEQTEALSKQLAEVQAEADAAMAEAAISRKETTSSAARAAAETDALEERIEAMEVSIRCEVGEANASVEAKFEALILEKSRATEEAVSALAAQEVQAREEQADQARLQNESLKDQLLGLISQRSANDPIHTHAEEPSASEPVNASAFTLGNASFYTVEMADKMVDATEATATDAESGLATTPVDPPAGASTDHKDESASAAGSGQADDEATEEGGSVSSQESRADIFESPAPANVGQALSQFARAPEECAHDEEVDSQPEDSDNEQMFTPTQAPNPSKSLTDDADVQDGGVAPQAEEVSESGPAETDVDRHEEEASEASARLVPSTPSRSTERSASTRSPASCPSSDSPSKWLLQAVERLSPGSTGSSATKRAAAELDQDPERDDAEVARSLEDTLASTPPRGDAAAAADGGSALAERTNSPWIRAAAKRAFNSPLRTDSTQSEKAIQSDKGKELFPAAPAESSGVVCHVMDDPDSLHTTTGSIASSEWDSAADKAAFLAGIEEPSEELLSISDREAGASLEAKQPASADANDGEDRIAIQIKTLFGEAFSVDVGKESTIGQIKQEIFVLHGTSPTQQRLVTREGQQLLDDSHRLCDYDVDTSKSLLLVKRLGIEGPLPDESEPEGAADSEPAESPLPAPAAAEGEGATAEADSSVHSADGSTGASLASQLSLSGVSSILSDDSGWSPIAAHEPAGTGNRAAAAASAPVPAPAASHGGLASSEPRPAGGLFFRRFEAPAAAQQEDGEEAELDEPRQAKPDHLFREVSPQSRAWPGTSGESFETP